MAQKRIKGSMVVLVLLAVMLLVSLAFHAIDVLYTMSDEGIAQARKGRAELIVAELDAMEDAGTLDQYDLGMAPIVGKPRMMAFKQVDGVEHLMVIVGSEDWYVELYTVREGEQMFAGSVYAAHHVWVGCCSEGDDRWWVMDEGLFEAYLAVE